MLLPRLASLAKAEDDTRGRSPSSFAVAVAAAASPSSSSSCSCECDEATEDLDRTEFDGVFRVSEEAAGEGLRSVAPAAISCWVPPS